MKDTLKNQSSQEDAPDAFQELRKSLAAIESKYSSPELQRELNKFMQEKGYVSASRGRMRKDPVAKTQGFAKALNVSPAFFVPTDHDIVRYFLMETLWRTGHEVVISEFSYMRNICDVMAVAAGRAVEFEIKQSRDDYFVDFKKTIFMGRPVSKHGALAAGHTMISRFYFVVPANMIDKRECPAHAGLIWYTLQGDVPFFRVVKHPALLHNKYISAGTWQTICKRLMARARQLTDRYVNSRFLQLKAQSKFYAHG